MPNHLEEQDAIELANNLVRQYWNEFKAGTTWNFFSSRSRYDENLDTWATSADWEKAARECLSKKSNVLQALEILLAKYYDQYFGAAEKLVVEWFDTGGHDEYYFYDLLARFPLDHHVRQSVLSADRFEEFCSIDFGGETSLARRALTSVKDDGFCKHLSQTVDSYLRSKSTSDDEMEDIVVPLVVDLGPYASEYIADDQLQQIKDFVFRYLENDRVSVTQPDRESNRTENHRSLWIRDVVAFQCWRLGWFDCIEILCQSDWYWQDMSIEFLDDGDNRSLLTWCAVTDNEVIRKQAIALMTGGGLHRLDGAIAWKRLQHRKAVRAAE